MRLWSIHPKYLDPIGIVALWRESLLARKVLEGSTKGYKSHPQLYRFKSHPQPLRAINTYLYYVWQEARARGYQFQENKIAWSLVDASISLPVSSGQLVYEVNLLLYKLSQRNPEWFEKVRHHTCFTPNPIFKVIPGPIEYWEKQKTTLRVEEVNICTN
ncbi:pyrimidine dimer DNA glycosylase/endonuclease V [Thermofilum sp.]|jgi:hypothetical protein|uniref:pyrimidine dimer DNA glycosylase/endonuclease V n=1 Tax=Thermofilum sp. TaxID=1961369 RepID=UPI002588DB38|nr:pyrimidine dimer DNA glycosylase/endonuclease V [Thermofilum sp.]